MKKLILAVALFSVSSLALADGWVTPLIIGGTLGYIIGRPSPPPQVVIQQQPQMIYQSQPQVIYQQQPQVVYVYPTTAPVIMTPRMSCELKSEMINGQVVTGNYCYQR